MAKDNKGRRKLKNIFVDTGMQNRLGMNIVAINFCVAGIGLAVLFKFVMGLQEVLHEVPIYSESVSSAMVTSLVGIIGTAVITVVVTAGVNYLAGIYLSHRIAGPTKIIVDEIDNLIQGKSVERKELRPNDELKEIFAKVKELEKSLQSSS